MPEWYRPMPRDANTYNLDIASFYMSPRQYTFRMTSTSDRFILDLINYNNLMTETYIDEEDTSTVIDVFGSPEKVGQDENWKPEGSIFSAKDKIDMSGMKVTKGKKEKSNKDKIMLAVPKNLIYVGFCFVILAFWYMLRLIIIRLF